MYYYYYCASVLSSQNQVPHSYLFRAWCQFCTQYSFMNIPLIYDKECYIIDVGTILLIQNDEKYNNFCRFCKQT